MKKFFEFNRALAAKKNFLSSFAFAAMMFSFASCGGNDGNDPVIKGVFSVGQGQQVCFSKGNLQATYDGSNWHWAFAPHQWSIVGYQPANNSITGDGTVSVNKTVDLFGWSTQKTTYGINNSTDNSIYAGNFEEWGPTIGDGWFTLSAQQWDFLIHQRSNAGALVGYGQIVTETKTINGIFLLPDDFEPSKLQQFNFQPAAEKGFRWEDNNGYDYYTNDYSLNYSTNVFVDKPINNSQDPSWADFEAEGVVFLPTADRRNGLSLQSDNFQGYYWSSTPANQSGAHTLLFNSSYIMPKCAINRYYGCSVRLARYVK